MQASNSPEFLLKSVFGFNSFQNSQEKIISSILNKQDTLAIMPTGGGKSLCFQIPALIMPGVTLIISPLLSLMKDQVDALRKREVAAIAISSLQTSQEQKQVYANILNNVYKMIYVSPERLQSKKFICSTKNLHISQIVIDEAHCISQWGTDFRPSYKSISTYLQLIRSKPVITAFTATATQHTQKDIIRSVHLSNPTIFNLLKTKTNLAIHVLSTPTLRFKLLLLFRLLNKHKNQSGIIFCATRSMTRQLCNYLQKFNITSKYFHAKLNVKRKNRIQNAFITQDPSLIITTNAFGMGIDKKNVRFVIHFQTPTSIEDFYQEIGRAGRDGNHADSYLLHDAADYHIAESFIKDNTIKKTQFKHFKKFLTSKECRSQMILKYFGKKTDACSKCDNCKFSLGTSSIDTYISQSEIIQMQKIHGYYMHSRPQTPFTQLTIALIAAAQPKSLQQLKSIPGIGEGFITTWPNILELLQEQ